MHVPEKTWVVFPNVYHPYTSPIPSLYHPYTIPIPSLYHPYTTLYRPPIPPYTNPYTTLYHPIPIPIPPYTALYHPIPPYTIPIPPYTTLYHPYTIPIPSPYRPLTNPYIAYLNICLYTYMYINIHIVLILYVNHSLSFFLSFFLSFSLPLLHLCWRKPEDDEVEPMAAELSMSPQWEALAAEVQASDLEESNWLKFSSASVLPDVRFFWTLKMFRGPKGLKLRYAALSKYLFVFSGVTAGYLCI